MARNDPIPDLKRSAAAALAPLLEGWHAHDVAVLIGTDQPRISDLRRGNLKRFSLETLIRYLTRLGMHVELNVEDDRRKSADPDRGASKPGR